MIRLLGVELTRLRWRRAVLILLAVCFLVPAIIWGGLAWGTRPYSPEELASIQGEYAEMFDSQVVDCTNHPKMYIGREAADLSPDEIVEQCRQMMGNPDDYYYLDRQPLDVTEERVNTGFGVITILIGLVMLIGTTFAGHDWNSGSMSNQLLFEPRRFRVWGAKALVVFAVGLVTSLLALAGFWLATAALASSRDLVVPAGTWDLIRESVLRGALLASLAGVGAYALTMLFRSTVATLGIMFGTSIGATILIGVIFQEQAERWMLHSNVYAWLFDGFDYYDDSLCRGGSFSGDGSECMAHLSQSAGATYLLVMLTAAVAFSVWSFRRRDVP